MIGAGRRGNYGGGRGKGEGGRGIEGQGKRGERGVLLRWSEWNEADQLSLGLIGNPVPQGAAIVQQHWSTYMRSSMLGARSLGLLSFQQPRVEEDVSAFR